MLQLTQSTAQSLRVSAGRKLTAEAGLTSARVMNAISILLVKFMVCLKPLAPSSPSFLSYLLERLKTRGSHGTELRWGP